MTDLQSRVRASVEDIHVFFEDWFMGRVPRASLKSGFLDYLSPGFHYIPPGGPVLSRPALEAMFLDGHGSARGFSIATKDVTVRWESSTHVLASYKEHQSGASPPAAASNVRLSSVLMAKGDPLIWEYVQETAVAS